MKDLDPGSSEDIASFYLTSCGTLLDLVNLNFDQMICTIIQPSLDEIILIGPMEISDILDCSALRGYRDLKFLFLN